MLRSLAGRLRSGERNHYIERRAAGLSVRCPTGGPRTAAGNVGRRTDRPQAAASTSAFAIHDQKQSVNILIDVAIADGHFITLAKAMTAAGLIDTVKGAGPFAVISPTDDACARPPSGTLDDLLKRVPKLTARRRRPSAVAT